jgi:hypothetical protein
VEADESYVGGSERGLRGGRWLVGKTLVAGAVERRPHGAGRVRLAVLEGLTFEQHLGPFVRGVIDPSQATVRTVGFQGYRRLSKVGVRHERFVQGTDPARSAEILPRVHRIFGNLKTWFRGTFHGVSGKHLPRYLAGFVYRFDRRWREGEIFGFVLQRAAQGEPFYGAPAPAADVGRIEAPLLLHLAEQDERINALWPAYRDALEAHGKPYQAYVQPGTRHGFHNDTTPRYDAADARLAWEGTVTFFRTHLVGGG